MPRVRRCVTEVEPEVIVAATVSAAFLAQRLSEGRLFSGDKAHGELKRELTVRILVPTHRGRQRIATAARNSRELFRLRG